ncbi:MAG: RecX family transcriptional regulator [Chitinophagales bacterium]|nr:RecX family transcriptional regulator [Chitinophagales bacterium]
MSKWVSKEEALKKMQRYCAYQDRCHQEVRKKLMEMGVYPDWREEVIVELIQENFLNEERFARSFARGKFRMKQWGKLRILRELKQRDISEYCIRKAMDEIEEEDYLKTLQLLIEKKANQLKETDSYKKRNKIVQYLLQRGYESALAWDYTKSLIP